MTPSTQSSILSMLHGRASLRPDDIAFTFTDYTNSPTGVAESLTWSQLSRRTFNVARELAQHASPGDRALILAPQSLEYILAFLGSMQAGLIAVPLPLPHRGSSLDRVSAVFDDTSPSVVLTTSAVASDVGDYVDQSRLEIAPKLIEIDTLRLDVDAGPSLVPGDVPNIAYLQYSSGSTRTPTGVMLSHRNLQVNFEQLMRSFFVDTGCTIPSNATIVSWLPFYHDMGLVLGVCAPILGGYRADLTSPLAFLESPSRWVRALATNPHAWSSAPNFAFDLAARKTTDTDLAGLDLGGVLGIISGAERVEQATLQRFVDRFAHFNFRDSMMRPSYGLAEATVFVASGTWSETAPAAHFDVEELSAGRVRRCAAGAGTALVQYKVPHSPVLRIIDNDTHRECPADVVGEIWVHGDNVASGYWRKSPDEQRCFGARITDPSAGTPEGPWLRTGDLGFVSEGELFIVGRIKDLLIIRGRNYYPEDIEATVQEISRGRVAAISVPFDSTEKLVTVIELKKRSDTDIEAIRSEITSAISNAHGVNVGDVVLVPPGSLPTTTSGKIRRRSCVELYLQHEFTRLDADSPVGVA
ncbi:fatty-acid--CoA ligase fadD21 [Mycobacteroides abscessus subsp. bolletii]|uniref:Acyl-CoA synthetase n=2 Tax=Mycobacteroides abscessus TaxID=36809 RepID=A0A9Q7SHX5_9MYCO|nr:AMP-binding protein [Mycobacteroides abscessus]MDO3067736.1 AMP-binding protein [Mycobacteroides abscessus subsp. bolletii]MDO3126793.1 AMP-binding protein [Mycobacteroides abscessus subsp. bolletii]UEA49230.1 AMP-binding protein [Mycobacteroides abscessus subsp. abscessus]UEA54964.1 AMP-binding protein [Mycobacteroides abscessus]CPW39777.1 fatty-acid--CoA ligase fadD21 [Mycobacteroides abscessus]